MFQVVYALNELRRRAGRTVLTALGLAAGVGLVIGIMGVSRGLERAQQGVLAPLTSIGTDILVTRVAGEPSASPSPQASPAPQPGPGGFLFGGGGPGAVLASQDTAALLQENSTVLTDLSKLGKPGEPFTRDFFLSGTFLSFPQEAVDEVRKVDGVASAVAGLTLLASHQTGTVPQIVAEIQTGGQTLTQTVVPEPMTEAERQAFQQCVQERGGPAPGAGPGPGPGGGFRGGGRFEECLPQRFREFRAQFVVPLQTIRQVVNPPSTNIQSTSYTAAGIDPAHPDFGLVTRRQLTAGRWIAADNEVLAAVSYANRLGLKVGSEIPINGTTFTVVGLVSPTLTGSTADLYFSLPALQALSGKTGRITQILVRASDAGSVDRVAAAIRKELPGAEVVTTKALADQVTGSLADARKLTARLGGALAVMVLAAAFAIAVLLTLSSVAKRVREIGTLRAIGWSKARVVGQVLCETVGIGVLGAALGIVVGVAVSVAVAKFSPELTATTTGVPGLASSPLAGLFGRVPQAAAQTSTVRLTAPLHPVSLGLGVALAIAGGLLSGAVGGWRAARLSPAQALSNVG